jgi:hypothetical protein
MAGRRRTQPPRPPVGPPANAGEGAMRVRALLVQTFDRKDGTGADWALMLESLFRAGFQITDERPDDEARRALMLRVHAGAYDRAAGNSEAVKTGQGEVVPAPSNTAGLHMPSPRPPK